MRSENAPANARFGVFATLIVACFLMGGGSRIDIQSLLVLQPVAALSMGAFVLIPGPRDWHRVRTPVLLLCALGLLMGAQLLPLPSAVWVALPGRELYVKVLAENAITVGWRPMSVTPDETLASLVGLVVPAAVLIGYASLSDHHRRLITPLVLGLAVLDVLLALLQLTGGSGSPFYTYQITNRGSPVGFFSNRNHHAVLLAAILPLVAIWAGQASRDRIMRRVKYALALTLAPLIILLIMATGSRAGLLLALGGLAFAWLQVRADNTTTAKPNATSRWLALGSQIVPVALGLVVVVMAIFSSRGESFKRLVGENMTRDLRVDTFPIVLHMVRDFFPLGAGFGTFDPTFRAYEPISMLSGTYLNHAHSDFLEIVYEGGLPAVLILLGLLGWLCAKAVKALQGSGERPDVAMARLGLAIVVLAAASSLVDYPLRTPLFGAFFALGCSWLGSPEGSPKPSDDRPKSLYRPANPV